VSAADRQCRREVTLVPAAGSGGADKTVRHLAPHRARLVAGGATPLLLSKLFAPWPAAPAKVGVAIAALLCAVLALTEVAAGRLSSAPAAPRDLHLAAVHVVLLVYLLTARECVARRARATLDALADVLELDVGERKAREAAIGRYPRRALWLAGLAGAAFGATAPFLVRESPAHPWQTELWTVEVAWQRVLAPPIGWLLATYAVATIVESDRVSASARHLRPFDLFEHELLAPFSRFGLHVALSAVGMLCVMSLLLLERGEGTVVASLAAIALVAAVGGLLVPLRGLRERICEEKTRELARCRTALRRARDAVVDGQPPATQHARLSEVIAYTRLVESIREWPLSTPTVLRAGAYVLLPLVSWFAAAVGSRVATRVVALLFG
jgi:hypothetical protein